MGKEYVRDCESFKSIKNNNIKIKRRDRNI